MRGPFFEKKVLSNSPQKTFPLKDHEEKIPEGVYNHFPLAAGEPRLPLWGRGTIRKRMGDEVPISTRYI